VLDLAFIHQVLDGTGHVFDRHLRVNTVLIKQIDMVGPQALEHTGDHLFNVIRAADEPRPPLACLKVDILVT
jgi:hypothetical protein